MNDFVKIKLGDTWLDLPEELSIQIDTWNPLFETDRIPGTLTFPFTLPLSSVNNKVLGFPGHLSVARYRQPQLPCQLYLMGMLWRVGKLNLIKRTAKGYEVNFQTDVGDISAQLKEQGLRELDLGTEPLVLQDSAVYPEAHYALFPVYNPDFFEEKPEGFNGYVNRYENGGFMVSPANPMYFNYPITPFPYLVHVLRKAMATFGYTLTGSWLEEEETRRLVIYNTHALFPQFVDDENALFTLQDHLPDMKVNEFLKAVRAFLCLGMVFNTTRKEVEIVSLRDVVEDRSYVDWSGSTGRLYDWEPCKANGFKLEMAPDPDDALQKAATDLTFTMGAGQELISCAVATLPMKEHYIFPGGIGGDFRKWLVPEASQVGGPFSFRLLSYRGLQPSTEAGQYPLGSSSTVNALGEQVGTDSLEWAGPKGLYERRHKDWLGFLSEAEAIQTEQTFRIHELLGLDCRRRSFIRHESGTFTGLWEKVNITVSRKKGLQAAKVPMRRIY